MPYKLRNKIRHKFKKAKYKIRNWQKYERGLKDRGNICIWFSEDAIKQWYYNDQAKTVGRQFKYSTLAIETGLIVKIIFKLTYRSLEGFLSSICKMMGIYLDISDHTIFSRRASKIKSLKLSNLKQDQKINIIIDSTGLKLFSEEEWLKLKHKVNKKKAWRKLHLAIDEKSQQIVATELTTLEVSDEAMVTPMLRSINQPVTGVIADRVYDSNKVYNDIVNIVGNNEVKIIIPGRPNASKICFHLINLSKRRTNHKKWFELGPYKWQQETGYNKRSLVETTMMRYKKIIGEKLFSRKLINQKVESTLGSLILNRMLDLGKPISVRA